MSDTTSQESQQPNATPSGAGQPPSTEGTQAVKKIEFKEKEVKESAKLEKIEVKDYKDAKFEKIEKNETKEHKDAKNEKLEKNELKDHKDAKNEKVEKNEVKEHKDAKHEKVEIKDTAKIEIKDIGKELEKVQKDVEKSPKEIAEGSGSGNPGDPANLAGRVATLEQQMQHFINQSQRPDLSKGALTNEPKSST